jgi:hypothetical protein
MERGNTFEAPAWWLRLARRELANRGSYEKLSSQLAALVRRKKPWHHATLSRFATNDPSMKPSQEFAVALSLYFEIPSPIYIPRSLAEARAMQAIALLSREKAPRTARVKPDDGVEL